MDEPSEGDGQCEGQGRKRSKRARFFLDLKPGQGLVMRRGPGVTTRRTWQDLEESIEFVRLFARGPTSITVVLTPRSAE